MTSHPMDNAELAANKAAQANRAFELAGRKPNKLAGLPRSASTYRGARRNAMRASPEGIRAWRDTVNATPVDKVWRPQPTPTKRDRRPVTDMLRATTTKLERHQLAITFQRIAAVVGPFRP